MLNGSKKKVWIIVFVTMSALFAGGCKNDDEELDTQRANIEKYLDGKSISYSVHQGVYKYIVNADREGVESEPIAKDGDLVRFYFSAHQFSSSNGLGSLYYTNIYDLIAENETLNISGWSFEPYEIRLGQSSLIPGLSYGIPDSRRGDSIQLFFASDLGYGDTPNGLIPQNSTLAWLVVIDEVIKP